MSSISFMSLRLNINLIPARRLAFLHRFTFYNNTPKRHSSSTSFLVQLALSPGRNRVNMITMGNGGEC